MTLRGGGVVPKNSIVDKVHTAGVVKNGSTIIGSIPTKGGVTHISGNILIIVQGSSGYSIIICKNQIEKRAGLLMIVKSTAHVGCISFENTVSYSTKIG